MNPKNSKHNFLRELRLNKNLTKHELAEAIGIHTTTIHAIESGAIKCGELNARRLGEFFKEDWKKFLTFVRYES